MQRFYIPELNFAHSIDITRQQFPDLYHQLTKVLRCQINDQYCFFGQDNKEHFFTIKKIEKESIICELLKTETNNTELPYQLILIQALPQKAEKWEWLLQKGTELGVSHFMPLITERTQRHHLPKNERLEKIMIEAAEQSGRTSIPKLMPLQDLTTYTFESDTEYYFASLQGTDHLSQQLKNSNPTQKKALIIGPEGGFSPSEETALLNKGAKPYSLGKRILRLETAALVSLGIMNEKLEAKS